VQVGARAAARLISPSAFSFVAQSVSHGILVINSQSLALGAEVTAEVTAYNFFGNENPILNPLVLHHKRLPAFHPAWFISFDILG